jgi:hypothetical protein
MQHAPVTSGALLDISRAIPAALLVLGCIAACGSRTEPGPASGASMPRLLATGTRWSTVIGGDALTEGAAIAVHDHDTIVAGSFHGSLGHDNLGRDGQALRSAGQSDVFLARLDPRGKPRWTLRMGGPDMDRASSLATRPDRIALSLQITPPAEIDGHIVQGSGQPDAALVALTPDGRVAWIQPIPGSRYARITGIALAEDGSITIAGWFAGTVRVGERSLTSAGATDVLLARFAADGTPQWALRLGGPGADTAHGVAGSPGQLVLIGHLDGHVDLGATFVEAPGAAVIALDTAGNLQWLRGLGQQATLQAVAADADAIFLAGHFQDAIRLGEHALDSRGQSDAFLGRLDHQGAPAWLVQLGGPGTDQARALALTPRGPILGGTFEQALTLGDRELTSAGATDAFAVELARDTGTLALARRFGGPGYDDLAALAAGVDRVVLTGSFEGSTEDTPEDTVDLDDRALAAQGRRSAFAVALDL